MFHRLLKRQDFKDFKEYLTLNLSKFIRQNQQAERISEYDLLFEHNVSAISEF